MSSRKVAPVAGRQGVSGVPQVVEMSPAETGSLQGRQPDPATEVAMPKGRAERAREDQRVWRFSRVLAQVLC